MKAEEFDRRFETGEDITNTFRGAGRFFLAGIPDGSYDGYEYGRHDDPLGIQDDIDRLKDSAFAEAADAYKDMATARAVPAGG